MLIRSPHVRGDGPSLFVTGSTILAFSPRAWGWSELMSVAGLGRDVLPTCVGMVRHLSGPGRGGARSPHVRGDGPSTVALDKVFRKFSPRAWGWSAFEIDAVFMESVLPTCVGMVLCPSLVGPASATFSPRAWGWSDRRPALPASMAVLPTCVGMVRVPLVKATANFGSPHVRGDGPVCPYTSSRLIGFSPRAWGWSGAPRGFTPYRVVLPTCVGMVRLTLSSSASSSGSPHVRGDGPVTNFPWEAMAMFSPRAWGWSGLLAHHFLLEAVLPTCVGMVRCRSRSLSL